jgi:hypothetical protein
MDDKDANIKFLLDASPEVLNRWFASVPPDDHLYAIEILIDHIHEILFHFIDALIEIRISVGQLAESKALLSRYTLNPV